VDEESKSFAKNWGIIANVAGLGKTLMITATIMMITATIMSQDQSDDSKYMVIVVPPPAIYQWESVLERYGVLTSSFAIIENHSDLPKAIKEGVWILLVSETKLEKWQSYAINTGKGHGRKARSATKYRYRSVDEDLQNTMRALWPELCESSGVWYKKTLIPPQDKKKKAQSNTKKVCMEPREKEKKHTEKENYYHHFSPN
jgi:hypothetical protein